MLLIILILIIPRASQADDRLDQCERLLFQQANDLLLAQEEISRLYEEIEHLIQEKAALQNNNDILQSQIGTDTGLYAGAVIGYPLFTGLAVIEYRFPRWSPMIVGGYSSCAFIGAGINIKLGKRE